MVLTRETGARLRRLLTDDRFLGRVLHPATLLIAAAVLLFENRGQWFYGDDFEFIFNRGLGHSVYGLFTPHNEHWSTVPILVYRALFNIFGLRSYTPYVVVLVALHIGA